MMNVESNANGTLSLDATSASLPILNDLPIATIPDHFIRLNNAPIRIAANFHGQYAGTHPPQEIQVYYLSRGASTCFWSLVKKCAVATIRVDALMRCFPSELLPSAIKAVCEKDPAKLGPTYARNTGVCAALCLDPIFSGSWEGDVCITVWCDPAAFEDLYLHPLPAALFPFVNSDPSHPTAFTPNLTPVDVAFLYEHQKQTLQDMWSADRPGGVDVKIWLPLYPLTGTHITPPELGSLSLRPKFESFQGGVLSDGAGTGKTHTMCALVRFDARTRCGFVDPAPLLPECIDMPMPASNLMPQPSGSIHVSCDNALARPCVPVNATLVVVRTAVLARHWASVAGDMELQVMNLAHQHLNSSNKRLLASLPKADMVIMTLDQLHHHMSPPYAGDMVPLLGCIQFRRLVMDDAHTLVRPGDVGLTTKATSLFYIQRDRCWMVSGRMPTNSHETLELLRLLHPRYGRSPLFKRIIGQWMAAQAKFMLHNLLSVGSHPQDMPIALATVTYHPVSLPAPVAALYAAHHRIAAGWLARRNQEAFLSGSQALNLSLGQTSAQNQHLTDVRLYAEDYDTECAVCQSPHVAPMLLQNCNHVFCRTCIAQWGRSQRQAQQSWDEPVSNTCPLCRAQFDPSTTTRVRWISAQADPSFDHGNGPISTYSAHSTCSAFQGKFPKLVEILSHTPSNNVVVFSHFTSTLRQARRTLETAHISATLDTSLYQRADGPRVLLAPKRLGEVGGVDFRGADVAIFLEPSKNRQIDQECINRVGRSLRKPLNVHTIYVQSTIEESYL